MDDLSTIRNEALERRRAGGRSRRARRRARGGARQEGQRHRPDEDAGRARRPSSARNSARGSTSSRARSRRRLEARKSTLGTAALAAKLASEKVDVTLPARPERRGTLASDRPGDGRACRDLRRDGLRLAEGPDIEDDWHNFTRPQHPARPSGAADAGHLLSAAARRRHADGAAHPHLAGAGAHHARQGRAEDAGRRRVAAHHRAGPHLPHRQRRDPHADVPPGRRPGDRPHDAHGPPQGLPGRFLPRLLRGRRPAAALPPLLLPVHRAVGRGRYRLLVEGRRAQDRRRRFAGWRSSAAAWCIPTCSPIAASIPPCTRASPSAWASIASPC